MILVPQKRHPLCLLLAVAHHIQYMHLQGFQADIGYDRKGEPMLIIQDISYPLMHWF